VAKLLVREGFTNTVDPPRTSLYFESRSVDGEAGGGVGRGSGVIKISFSLCRIEPYRRNRKC